MGKCCVPFCQGKATSTFPRDEKRRMLWEKAINVNFRSSKSSRLCSNHFEKELIVEKKESYYTGIKTSKRTLKPNAVPTLMLELEVGKSRRSEIIRKALFEEGSNNSNSSSLSLSLLDDSMHISEDNFANMTNTLIESPVQSCTSSSSHDNEVPSIISPVMSDCPTITETSTVPDVYYIDVQVEEAPNELLMPESDKTVQVESTHSKSSEVIEQKSSTDKKKGFISIGVQAGRGLLSVQTISHRDDVVHYYTGLGTYAKFQFVYGTLSDYVNDIKYINGQVNFVEPQDMFLLTIVKLRRNIPDFGLSFYFGVSEAVVRNIFNTWIHYIYQLWSLLDTWPSREVVDFYMPEGFKKFYPSTRVIVDATEIPINKPSNPIAQQATFSTYKNKNTVKVLVGGTPDGILCYHSAAYGGSTSDRQIVERSNLVQRCQKGDSVMADRGFNVQDIFESQGVTINIPRFLKGKQLPSVTVLSDRKLASKRVHIERLIGLTKTYKILREPLNPSYTRLATKIFSICLMLCNFRESVISSVA